MEDALQEQQTGEVAAMQMKVVPAIPDALAGVAAEVQGVVTAAQVEVEVGLHMSATMDRAVRETVTLLTLIVLVLKRIALIRVLRLVAVHLVVARTMTRQPVMIGVMCIT